MAKKNKQDIRATIFSCFFVSIVIFVILLVNAYNQNRSAFWGILLSASLIVVASILLYNSIKASKINSRNKKINKILSKISEAQLDSYVDNFISRFGLGQEGKNNSWEYRNYSINFNRIKDLHIFLEQKGIKFSDEDIFILLSEFIDKKEFNLTINSMSSNVNKFSTLSGHEFEGLLYRLYEKMDYSVQINGKSGDQGGDLIANKEQERILIQAKCYKDWSVGNSAIQEAVAAKNHYDCNRAIVITTSYFTESAKELAKTNNIELISKELLQKMLMDHLNESWA